MLVKIRLFEETSETKALMADIEFRVAREFDVVKIRITKDGQERLARLQEANACLGCEEPIVEGERVTCGLCTTCYNAAITAVQKKKTTRQELIREGKMLPPTKGGRKPVNKFTRELAER